MKRRKQSISWDIIYKKLNGSSLTTLEERQLQVWLAAASENRSYFEQAKQYYQKGIEDLEPELVPDTTSQFLGKLERRTKLRRLYRNLKIAASLVLPALLLGGAWLTYELTTTEETEIVEQLEPISNKAKLITTGGDVLTLEGGTAELVDSVAGVRIVNDSLTGLSYPTSQDQSVVQEAFNTLITPRGGEYQLTLSDGTRVWLNCESELKYPVAFNGTERKVLLKGEAFFDVEKDQKPFIVETDQMNVRVLGTRFNVSAYADADFVQATLTRGRIQAEAKGLNDEFMQISLTPGEQAQYTKTSGGLIAQPVDTSLYVGWVNGYFRFEDRPLEEVLQSMSRWYDVDFVYSKNVDRQKVLTGKLNRNDNFDVIMNLVSRISETSFERDGTKIKISSQE